MDTKGNMKVFLLTHIFVLNGIKAALQPGMKKNNDSGVFIWHCGQSEDAVCYSWVSALVWTWKHGVKSSFPWWWQTDFAVPFATVSIKTKCKKRWLQKYISLWLLFTSEQSELHRHSCPPLWGSSLFDLEGGGQGQWRFPLSWTQDKTETRGGSEVTNSHNTIPPSTYLLP